jgi:hypothetical protein
VKPSNPITEYKTAIQAEMALLKEASQKSMGVPGHALFR